MAIKDTFEKINSSNKSENDRCQETQKYIKSSFGFGYFEIRDILKDLQEEISELEQELNENDEQRIFEELGDVIFVLCNLAFKNNIKLDSALKYSTDEYQRRWNFIEEKLGSEENIAKTDRQTLINLWKEAKKFKK